MKKPYNLTAGFTRRLRQLGLTALLAGGATVAAQAQTLSYPLTSITNAAGTYTDLGTTGTAIATTNTDDANSAAQNIGFTFTYNGTAFTQFVFNTNGVIRLGSAAPSTATLYYDNDQNNTTDVDPLQSTDPADVNLLMPFNIDLVPGTGAVDYRVLTSGTAPNRVCTIQWRNVADKAGAGTDVASGTQYANFSFQIKLYETTNAVDFVYGPATAGSAAAALRYVQVGLKGAGLGTGQVLLALKDETKAWSTTTFQNTNYGSDVHNIAKVALPDAGRTYHFSNLVANDIAVRAVYALGKVATPGAVPQAVRVYLTNLGTAAQSNVAVTLTISGANTYTATATVATLAVGTMGTLSFAAAPATLVAGTNTITVSVAADDNSGNNSMSVQQLVTTNRLSHIAPNAPTDGALSGSNTTAGSVLTTKYTVPVANTVYLSEALISFANVTGSPTTAFQVVVQDATGVNGTPGTVLYTSTTQNRPAAGGDVPVLLPAIAVSGSFFVGVKEIGATGVAIATQSETPLRNTTFYYSATGAAPWTDIAGVAGLGRLAIEVGLSAAPNCVAPASLAVVGTTATSATISFTDASNSGSYQLVYGAVGFTPTTGGTTVAATASPATITGLQPGTTYQVYIRANCSAGGQSVFSAPITFSTPCAAITNVTAFPYTQSFDAIPTGQTVPCGITVLDANADGTTWRVSTENPYSGTYAMRYQGALLNNVVANDWFFTPALVLPGTANTRYQVAFRYRATGVGSTGASNFTESLEVKSGTAATAAGQTNLLYTNASINNLAYAQANGTSAPVVAYLPAGASTQYVGFHVISAANQSNLYIDDLSVTAVVVTATSDALLRAVTVYPNPSTTGVFDLAISGANAKQGLEVEVTNNLGQRVYVGSARDNFTSQLDLSRLATGLYHLKVKNGDEYMLRQISIVK